LILYVDNNDFAVAILRHDPPAQKSKYDLLANYKQ